MATVLATSGETREVQPATGTVFALEELQELVGGYIELISLPDGRLLFVNEDGLNQGLPFNEAATQFLLALGARTDTTIVGDVVICRRDEVS